LRIRRISLALVLGFVAACGDDSRHNANDLSPIPAPTQDLTPSAVADLAQPPDLAIPPDMSAPVGDGGVPGLVREVEPYNRQINDTASAAQIITLDPAVTTIEGTIGDINGTGSTAEDIDDYRFEAHGGELYRLEASALSSGGFEPFITLTGPNGYTRRLAGVIGVTQLERELFLPVAGQYTLLVEDARNEGTSTGIAGGMNVQYRIVLTKLTPNPTAVTIPLAQQMGTIGASNEVPVYSFDAVKNSAYYIDVRTAALALTPPSELDVDVYLVDATATPNRVVASYTSTLRKDAQFRAVASKAGRYLIVVDYVDVVEVKKYGIAVSTYDPTTELEQNDTIALANPIPTAGVGNPITINAAISPPLGGQLDIDAFSFYADAGSAYAITVRPADASSVIQPTVRFYDPSGREIFSNPNRAGAQVVKLEAYAILSGIHTIVIGDVRNEANPPPVPLLGGPEYAYKLEINPGSRGVVALGDLPLTTAPPTGDVDAQGASVVYQFNVPAGNAKQVFIDLDVGTAGGKNGLGLRPVMRLFDPEGKVILAGAQYMFPDLVLRPGRYTLAVGDADGRFSATNHSFRARVLVRADASAPVDDGTHDNIGRALQLDARRSQVDSRFLSSGTISSSAPAEIWYSLGVIPVGTQVVVYTDAIAGETAPTSHSISLVTAAGTALRTVSTTPTSITPINERLLVQAEYFVRVFTTSNTNNGRAFRLNVLLNDCAYPRTQPRLVLNEVFAHPDPTVGTNAGDANGDAMTDPAGDEFIEVVSRSAQDLFIGGVYLRDATGVRARVACVTNGLPTTLAAGAAFAVFGDCSTAGCRKANASPTAPFSGTADATRLDLADDADAVILTDASGATIDAVYYGPGTTSVPVTANVSLSRGPTCDVLTNATPAFIDHTSCGLANGRAFSAGVRADNLQFRSNDTCEGAVPLELGVVYLGDTTGAISDYQPVQGTTGVACRNSANFTGPDVTYSVVVPPGRIVDVTVRPELPDRAWDIGVALTTDCLNQATQSCVALADAKGAPSSTTDGVETVSYSNTTANPVTLFVIVDADSTTADGTFSVVANLR
jgi:hypothetical protein